MPDVVIMFFALGLLAGLVKSDLKVPVPIYETLSILLMLTIGLKGGMALHGVPLLPLLPELGSIVLAGAVLLTAVVTSFTPAFALVLIWLGIVWVISDTISRVAVSSAIGVLRLVLVGVVGAFVLHSPWSGEFFVADWLNKVIGRHPAAAGPVCHQHRSASACAARWCRAAVSTDGLRPRPMSPPRPPHSRRWA